MGLIRFNSDEYVLGENENGVGSLPNVYTLHQYTPSIKIYPGGIDVYVSGYEKSKKLHVAPSSEPNLYLNTDQFRTEVSNQIIQIHQTKLHSSLGAQQVAHLIVSALTLRHLKYRIKTMQLEMKFHT